MIINFLTEDINNSKLNKEYNNNYSDLTENEFMTMVKMDPSSYPRNGKDFDLNADPVTVGNLASGGKSGLLIRCFRNGEKDFLNNFKQVQDACLKYLLNRGSYSIKNAGEFKSVQNFIDYVNSDGTLKIDTNNSEKEPKKANSPKDKLEQLRQKQFPNIETVDELIKVADLDEESDTDHGQVGNIAKTLLLPHYAAGEREFLNKKKSLKYTIQKYYNSSDAEIKKNPISKYNEKENNAYIRTVMDFIEDWGINIFKTSNLKLLLDTFADPERYSIWASTLNYDIIEYADATVGQILNLCDLTPEEIKSKFPSDLNPIYSWCREYDSSSHTAAGKVTNIWCTGWTSSYVDSYSGRNKTLVAFICRNRIPFDKECHKNWQVSIYNDTGNFNDIEDGNNNHNGASANLGGFLTMLEQNKDVLGILLAHSPFNKNKDIQSLANRLHVSPISNAGLVDISSEEDAEPFVYSSPVDVKKYKDETGDINCLNIDKLIIAEGVEKIPNFQFQNWKNLSKIIFPNSLKEIGSKAFSGCSSLVRLNLPPNLEIIGLGAFEGCISLRGSIRLPISIRKIEQNAFAFHNKKGIRFVISPKRLDAENPIPLELPKEDHDFWYTPDRIKFSDN